MPPYTLETLVLSSDGDMTVLHPLYELMLFKVCGCRSHSWPISRKTAAVPAFFAVTRIIPAQKYKVQPPCVDIGIGIWYLVLVLVLVLLRIAIGMLLLLLLHCSCYCFCIAIAIAIATAIAIAIATLVSSCPCPYSPADLGSPHRPLNTEHGLHDIK